MKRLITKIIIMSIFFCVPLTLLAQDVADTSREKFAAWEADSNTILNMVSGLRNIEKADPNDSELQREYKSKQRDIIYKREFEKMIKTCYNRPLSLQAAMVKDVKAETRLNQTGQRKLLKVERAIKSGDPAANYLATQFHREKYKYEIETGYYEISFKIPVPDSDEYSIRNTGIKKGGSTGVNYDLEDRFNVTILLLVKSKAKALQYSKDDVVSLTGRISKIKLMDEYLIITLKE